MPRPFPLVAWDVETCPTPVDAMTRAQFERYEKELARELKRDPDQDAGEVSERVRSLHPHLAWICCVGAVAGTLTEGPRVPRSWTAAGPDGEADLLRAFWSEVDQFPAVTLWVTFNGKAFDVPMLAARSLRHGVAFTHGGLLNDHPYRHRPHLDLCRLWRWKFSLDGLCDLVSVPTPKGDLNGSGVASTIAAGRTDEVARYCERDVVATFECARRHAGLLAATDGDLAAASLRASSSWTWRPWTAEPRRRAA